MKIIDLKKAHEKIQEMEDNLKYMSNENENLKSKWEMNLDSDRNMSNLSKEKMIESNLSKKHQSLRSRHFHGNNSVDLVLKYKENMDNRNFSTNNLIDISEKNEISKSTFNLNQLLKAKLSKNQRSSVSPVSQSNYHSNAASSNLNLNQQIKSGANSNRRDSLAKKGV
jgi:hypothetical protein